MAINEYTFDVEVAVTAKVTIRGTSEEQARGFLENGKTEYICEAMFNHNATATIVKATVQDTESLTKD